MYEANTVSVALDGRWVVHDAVLAATPGEVTIVLGPNGSGKTTLLRALSGELSCTGTVRLNGHDIRTLPAWKTATMRAVLPQSTTLNFPFTVREIVAIGQRSGLSGLGDARMRVLPERALERVDLAGFGHRRYQDLSGGEQQRVQLARVLCQVWTPLADGVPRWLLLDEPVSSLDIKHQLAIMAVARDFADRGGGVIAILHDLNLAAMFADRVVLMRHGRIVANGIPAQTISADAVAAVFDVPLQVGSANGIPTVLPQSSVPSRGPL
jgi:iron complex transport system ATP-binding protein